jgi:hypothetical protein
VTAPRHLRVAEQVVAALGIHADEVTREALERAAKRLALYEQTIEADAVVYLHADRCTTEPTTFSEDRVLRPLLAEGEVAFALRPFPSGAGAVVLYGSPEQITDLCSGGIVPFLDDLVENPS